MFCRKALCVGIGVRVLGVGWWLLSLVLLLSIVSLIYPPFVVVLLLQHVDCK